MGRLGLICIFTHQVGVRSEESQWVHSDRYAMVPLKSECDLAEVSQLADLDRFAI